MSAAPTIGVLALQGDVVEHLRALTSAEARAVTVRRPQELAQVDGLVLPGGESTTIALLLRRFELMSPLREAVAAGLPVYGSCAGMILLADRVLDGVDGQESIGGLDITVRRNAFGRQVDSFEQELDAPTLTAEGSDDAAAHESGALHGVFIRAPWVEQVGDDVEVLARVAGGSAAGRIVAVRQGSLLATSFHPEISGDARVHRAFARMVAR